MAIYDCFQYFNEEHIADLRFNILDEFVDYFVIVESTVNHQGKSKKLQFLSTFSLLYPSTLSSISFSSTTYLSKQHSTEFKESMDDIKDMSDTGNVGEKTAHEVSHKKKPR